MQNTSNAKSEKCRRPSGSSHSALEEYITRVYPSKKQSIPFNLFLNIGGCLGFLIGSILYLVDHNNPAGLIVFSVSCVLDGVSCLWTLILALVTKRWFLTAAKALGLAGCLIYTGSSLPAFARAYRDEALVCYLIASLFFLIGSVICHGLVIVHVGWFAAHFIVPFELISVIGSALFTVGSIQLFYPSLFKNGRICYVWGSVMFLIAAIAMGVVWIYCAFFEASDDRSALLEETKKKKSCNWHNKCFIRV